MLRQGCKDYGTESKLEEGIFFLSFFFNSENPDKSLYHWIILISKAVS